MGIVLIAHTLIIKSFLVSICPASRDSGHLRHSCGSMVAFATHKHAVLYGDTSKSLAPRRNEEPTCFASDPELLPTSPPIRPERFAVYTLVRCVSAGRRGNGLALPWRRQIPVLTEERVRRETRRLTTPGGGRSADSVAACPSRWQDLDDHPQAVDTGTASYRAGAARIHLDA